MLACLCNTEYFINEVCPESIKLFWIFQEPVTRFFFVLFFVAWQIYGTCGSARPSGHSVGIIDSSDMHQVRWREDFNLRMIQYGKSGGNFSPPSGKSSPENFEHVQVAIKRIRWLTVTELEEARSRRLESIPLFLLISHCLLSRTPDNVTINVICRLTVPESDHPGIQRNVRKVPSHI